MDPHIQLDRDIYDLLDDEGLVRRGSILVSLTKKSDWRVLYKVPTRRQLNYLLRKRLRVLSKAGAIQWESKVIFPPDITQVGWKRC